MSKTFEEYLDNIEKNGDTFPIPKRNMATTTFKIGGSYGNYIFYKPHIYLSYGNSISESIIYIEDISEQKQFTNDLKNKIFKLHLSDTTLYVDFNTSYYYVLLEFDTIEQFKYCVENKRLTIALLNEDKSDIINKWTTDIELL